jgi:PAS domain S-box-containing protein
MKNNPKILILDDDIKLRKTLSDILSLKGYETVIEEKGEFAIAQVKNNNIAVGLIDLKLEDMSGVDVISRIKEESPFTECIVLTGYASQETAIGAINAGAYSYLQKPYDIEQLLLTIQRAFEKQTTLKQLRDSEERFRTAIINAPYQIMIHAEGGEVLQISKSWTEITGYTHEDIPTVYEWAKRTHGQIALDEEAINTINAVYKLRGRDRQDHGIWPIITKSGEKRYWDFSTTPLDALTDGRNTVITMAVDVTEKRILEKRLQQAQKMESIGDLAGGIAHDFNNLLFPILGMAELLLEDLPEDSREYENAYEIFVAGQRAGDLVKQILTFSRQSEHKMIPIRVQNVLKEVVKLCRSTIPTNIEIHENIQRNCGLVMADPTQVHQIAMNLITNAFHAVEEKNGVIDIELKEISLNKNELPDSVLLPGQYIRLSVSDNGIGMTQSTINKIFEPYFTTKKQGKGTGLGLAVVYGIVKEHKGDIKAYSEVGKGSTLNIYLPLMKEATEIVTADQVADIETGTERILLVDDDKSVAKLESKMLSRLGYQVTKKTKSPEALTIFKMNPEDFDLVITDMTMPDMTGDQLAKEILSIKPDTPIIICTGFSERINKKQAQIIGVKGFLMKPVVKSDMAQMVRKVLDKI